LPAIGRATFEPSPPKLGRELLFGLYALRLFHRQVGGHLVDPGRHSVGQGSFDGKIGRMARLTCGKLGRLLFGPLLGGRKLRLERIDMRFERPDDLIGQRSFIRIPEALRAAIHASGVVPTLRRPDPRALIVSERLLPSAALGPLSDRFGRHAQQFGGLSVGKPLARQIAPVGKTSDDSRSNAAAQQEF
jgi:hypothetical protein